MTWIVANSLCAGALALLALATGRWLRPAPAAMHVLWSLVLLKLITPPLVGVPLWTAAPPEPASARIELADLVAAAASPRAAAAPVLDWAVVLAAVWLAGSLGFGAWFGCAVRRGHRRVRALGPVPGWLRNEVAALAARLGVRPPELRDDPHAFAPCVWSLGRPCLLLPVRALAATTARGRATVIAHELAHLRRGDHRIAHAELALATVLWWHPLFWLGRAQLRAWAELACDAWAVATVPGAKLDYATVLVEAVARPDSAVPGLTVLAARPAARAAFERRLTMILNENVPCRASRGWWLPFATLGLSLFAVPVAAQHGEQEPARIEIQVNGKPIGELSEVERAALLRELHRLEAKKADSAKAKAGKARPRAKVAHDVQVDVDPTVRHEVRIDVDPLVKRDLRVDLTPVDLHDLHDHLQGLGSQVHEAVREALRAAKVEVQADADLRELGIAEHVAKMLGDLGDGKGVHDSIHEIVRAARKGAHQIVVKELQDDPDLHGTGLPEGVGKLIESLLGDERHHRLLVSQVHEAAAGALREVEDELRRDPGLKKLGIDRDVGKLVRGMLHGDGEFAADLQQVIDKALQAAPRDLHGRHGADGGGDGATDDAPAKAKAGKAPKGKKRSDPVIR